MVKNYPLLKILILVLALAIPSLSNAQTGAGCPNADFSYSTFQYWQGWYGTFTASSTSINTSYTPGFLPGTPANTLTGQQTLVNSAFIDPNTCGGLVSLPPGSPVCVRLGNSSTGNGSERMQYTITVDSSNALFIYKYAVVLQDPTNNHSTWERPKFEVKILNAAGQLLDTTCGVYSVFADAFIPGFNNCGDVRWKDWTVVGLNLSSWIGQTVTLQFTTYDCSLGGHWGYAYIAADCRPLTIDITYCPGDNSVVLVAPPGFDQYVWNTTPAIYNDSVVVTNPSYGTTYQVTMTTFSNGGNNCLLNLNAIIVPTLMTAGFDASTACQGLTTFTDTSVVFNGYGQSWLWDFGDNTISTLQNPTHTYAQPGYYPVQMIVFSLPNMAGCRDTIVDTILVQPNPDAGFIETIACVGNPSQFTDTSVGNNSVTGWLWNFGPNAIPATSTAQNPTPIFTSSGTYNVMLVSTNNFGCTDTMIKQITAGTFPSTNFAFQSQCAGIPINFNDITVTSATDSIVSWSWTMGDGNFYSGSPTVSHIYNNGGVYNAKMVVTSANGCTDSITKLVTVYYNPQAVFTAPDKCYPEAVPFSSAGFVGPPSYVTGYSWNFGDNTSSTSANVTHQYTAPGSYIVMHTVSTNDGCVGVKIDTVYIYEAPQADFTVVPVCKDLPSVFTNTTISPSDGTVGSFVWNFGDGSPTNSTNSNPSHIYPNDGTYNVTLITYSSNLGCSDTVTKQATVHPLVTADFSLTDTCLNETAFFTDQSSGQVQSWNWNFSNNGATSLLQNPTHTYTAPGTYQVTLQIASNFGCMDSVVKSITIWPLPQPEFSTMNVCVGDRTFFYDLSTVVSPYAVVERDWTFGDGGNASGLNPNHTFTEIGDFLVTLTATTNKGCKKDISRMVEVHPIPEPRITMNLFEGCRPVCIQFSNNSTIGGGDNIRSVEWIFGDGGTSDDNSIKYCFSNPGIYDVELLVTSDYGCKANLFFNDTVKVYEFPVANFQANPPVALVTNPVIEFQNLSDLGYTYSWNFGDAQPGSSEVNPSHYYLNAGEYLVTLITTSENGCQDTIEYSVLIQSEFTLYIPSAFTPGSDGINDSFRAYGTGITDFEMEIYDRWGKQVFKSENLVIGWDGTIRDILGNKIAAQQDVYVYRVKAWDGQNPEPVIKDGHFTLIR